MMQHLSLTHKHAHTHTHTHTYGLDKFTAKLWLITNFLLETQTKMLAIAGHASASAYNEGKPEEKGFAQKTPHNICST